MIMPYFMIFVLVLVCARLCIQMGSRKWKAKACSKCGIPCLDGKDPATWCTRDPMTGKRILFYSCTEKCCLDYAKEKGFERYNRAGSIIVIPKYLDVWPPRTRGQYKEYTE